MDRDFAAPPHGSRAHRLGAFFLTSIAGVVMSMPGEAHALGVGRPVTQSSLGQPLKLVFPVRLADEETLTPDCVRAELTAGDARVPAGLVQLQLEGATESSVRAVRLQSLVQIDEPIVTVSLSLGCPARFTRQYTAFIDPPDLRAPSAPVEPPPAELNSRNYSPALRAALATADAKPQALLANPAAAGDAGLGLPVLSASVASAVAGATRNAALASVASSEGAPAADKPKARKSSRPAKPAGSDVRLAAAAVKPAAKQVEKPLPRLQLDPIEVLEPVSPAPAASSPELDAALARLQKLEERLNAVQQDGRGTQEKLLSLRAQLEAAQSQRYQNPLILSLGLAVLALLGLSAFLWRSRRSEREAHDSAWWNEVKNEARDSRMATLTEAPVLAAAPLPAKAAAPARAQDFEEQTMSTAFIDAMAAAEPDQVPEPEASAEPLSVQFVDSHLHTQPMPPLHSLAPASPGEAGTHVTVEELIDLEQQVDFFQVLGQDEAAIDLLQARIGTGMASALPYLKLMEIHQRRGEELAFADLSDRFGERFLALPPTWGSDLNRGRQLEAYARVLRRVQALWLDSAASMALLQNLLSRGSADESTPAQGFDLPAYRDLLLLYGVARDLSEHEVRSDDIDLFLPLDSAATRNVGNSMMATMVWQAAPGSLSSNLDVDLSLDEPTTKS